MTKTTNEPNEIICPNCGHDITEHSPHGCVHVDADGIIKRCRCFITSHKLMQGRISALEAAVEERDETIKKLRDELIWAWSEMSFLEYPSAEDAEYEFCKQCHEPEWSHKSDCKGVVHAKKAQILVAETAPKVQS